MRNAAASATPTAPADVHTNANDQFSEAPQAEHDDKPVVEPAEQQTADALPWAEEFAARVQSRKNAWLCR